MASTRRSSLPSDTGAFADWVSDKSTAVNTNDLCLGFNAAGPTSAAPSHHQQYSMWPTGTHSSRYGLPHHEMGMFVVAPATSFHHDPSLISADVGAIQFWQSQQAAGYLNKGGSISFDHNAAGAANAQSSGGDGGVGPTTCQDCGNQAKKDCGHRRCRTCCRSRGFDCSTHLKSTWVPAARRRERQMVEGNSSGGGGGGGASSGSTSGAKKPRLIASQNTTATTTSQTSNSNTPPRSFDTTSNHQDAVLKDSLPRQVRAPAVFKCVRVTAMDEGDDEYAYQAMVRIGGRIFKGFLYDQGTELGDGFPNLSELHLGGGSGGGGRNGMASSSSPLLDPSEVYGASGGGIPGGSGYGNTIN